MTKKLLCVAVALAPLCGSYTYAAVQDSNLPVNNLNADAKLKTVVVTASRVEEQIDDSLASVTVLDRDDIERLQATDFRELIAHVPGVDVFTSGAPGSNTGLLLRGTNTAHTLVLIDGQRVSSATTGTTNLQFLDPSQIERIEVVRGPKSSLYGSDAIGGVIHIFTRRNQENQSSAHASAGVGSRNSYEANVGGQANYNQWRLAATVSHYRTDGFSNVDSSQPPISDDDAYRNTSATANIGYDFSNTTSFDLNHFFTKARNESDGSTNEEPYSDNWMQSTNALLKTQVLPFWKVSVSAGHNVDDLDYFAAFPSDTRTTRNSASLQNDFTLSKSHLVTIGGDYDKDKVVSSTRYVTTGGKEANDRDNKGGFIQYIGEFGILDTQLGARHDDNDSFGSHKTENAALGIKLPENHKLILSYGTAFRAPGFNQLYYPNYGTPTLKPESSKNYEIEVRGNYSFLNWSANVFQNDIDDLIQTVTVAPRVSRAQNVAEARIRGAEIIVNTKLDEWLINASLAYVDPRDEQTNNVLTDRARRSLKIDADKVFGAWIFGTSFRAQDKRYINTSNSTHLGGYGLVDLRGGYNLSKNLDIQLKLTNVFDKSYQLKNTYNTERAGWFTTINYRM